MLASCFGLLEQKRTLKFKESILREKFILVGFLRKLKTPKDFEVHFILNQRKLNRINGRF